MGQRRGSPSPSRMRRAASPMRIRPATIIGFAASAPPDGLTSTPSPRPSASRRISSWCVNGAWSSATSTRPPCRRRRASPASRGRRRSREVAHAERRAARCGGRCRESTPAVAPCGAPVAGREHHGGGAVGDRRAVVPAERRDQVRLREQRRDVEIARDLRVRVRRGGAPAARGDLREVALARRRSPRERRAPAARRARSRPARAARGSRDRAGASAPRAGRPATTCRRRRPARSRPRRSGASPRPRRAPRRRPSRRATRRSAARRRPRRARSRTRTAARRGSRSCPRR